MLESELWTSRGGGGWMIIGLVVLREVLLPSIIVSTRLHLSRGSCEFPTSFSVSPLVLHLFIFRNRDIALF